MISNFNYLEITELQGASMSILEFILLQSERKKILKPLNPNEKRNLKSDIEGMNSLLKNIIAIWYVDNCTISRFYFYENLQRIYISRIART